jgi:hypothetical protein
MFCGEGASRPTKGIVFENAVFINQEIIFFGWVMY